MMKHQKHSKLTKKNIGNFSHLELAFVGHNCDVINNLVSIISNKLSKTYKLAYLDASHSNDLESLNMDQYTYHRSKNTVINKNVAINKYSNNIENNTYDLVFINGNHYPANRHVVFLNPEKENSIKKRIDQIEDILFFIKLDDKFKVFDCLKSKFPNFKEIPIVKLHEVDKMVCLNEHLIQDNIPKIDGLVLTGGKSIRMGKDKSKLEYYNKPHSEFLFDLLSNNILNVNYSVSKENTNFSPCIKDSFVGLGPFGAICSAFMHNPKRAYFVLATDLPFISDDLIKLILNERDISKIATTVRGESKDFPEPLITIWEPKSYQYLLNYLALGISCPRKVLINEDVKIIEVKDDLIRNVNTKEEFLEVKSSLK